MGLSIISEDKKVSLWISSYSGFADFRIELAEKVGLIKYNNGVYGARYGWKGNYEEADAEVKEECPELASLLMCSDFEGKWTFEDCSTIYKGLMDLNFKNNLNYENSHSEFSIDPKPLVSDLNYENLLNGLKYCIDNKMGAYFC